jgi:RimJ/RimL family protein N-acetyltransferase
MSARFCADLNPSDTLIGEVVASDPLNPFYTRGYIESMRTLGFRPWALSLRDSDRLVVACTAFSRSNYLEHVLLITSLPALPQGELFWQELLKFCRKARISRLVVNSNPSSGVSIPALPNELRRTTRHEFILDLQKPCLWSELSSNHKRNITAARKAGVQLRQTSSQEACRQHRLLMMESLGRRKERGEIVPENISIGGLMAPLEQRAGQLFQSVRDGRVLSSILVLTADRGAYYQSAGTSPEGMASGASQFTVYEMAEVLRDRGMEVLNLGGADAAASGLERFKLGFGSTKVGLECAEFYFGSKLRRRMVSALRLARQNPRRFFQTLVARLESFRVYAADPSDIAPPEPVAGVRFDKLSDEQLLSLEGQDIELSRQARRLRHDGFNGAYGVFRDECLAHIAWLIEADHDRCQEVRTLKLRPGEAEITHCFTLPEFRRQGLYSFAIRNLCQVAGRRGVRRVYMITSVTNVISQRGIERAGLRGHGAVIRLMVPLLSGVPLLTYRGYRQPVRN